MTVLRRPRTPQSALALAATLALGAVPWHDSLAAACTFIPASGNWNVAGNWSCGALPGALDTATVAAGRAAATQGGTSAGPTNLSNAGSVTISDNSGLTLLGSNQNTGNIAISSGGNFTELRISGAMSLNGAGTVTTSNSLNNRIVAASGAGDVLTLGVGQSIQGAASIGGGGALGVVNNGSIIANLSSGITLNAQGGVTNNGVLRGDGAVLTIQGSTVGQSSSGALNAINGGSVRLSSSSISGGIFSTASGGTISTASGTSNSLADVTNTGDLVIVDNSALRLTGTLTNNGKLAISSGGNFTDLVIVGAQTLAGTGTVTLSNTTNNRISGDNATFTLGSGQTLSGSGQIGAGSANFRFNNAGTVVATQGAPLQINASAGVNNTGTLRADGGTLQLQTTVDSAGGQIEARNGSRVELLNGSVINNAAFSATGAGSVITTVGGATVSMGGGTVNGPMTIADNSALRLTANATYNGVLSMASGGNFTELRIDGARTLGGTATIETSNTLNNRIIAANASGDSLTLGAGITVQGAASIGGGGTLGLVNNGSLIAKLSSGMTLSTSGNVTNNKLIRGDGATFTISGTTVNQGASGVLSAINGGSVRLTGGSSIVGGSLASADTAAVITGSGSNARLSGVTNTGTLVVVDNSTLFLDGTLTNNGSLNLSSGGNFTDLVTTGNRLIDGTGTITLSNSGNNRIYAAGAGNSLTLGANQTLQGAGNIGAGGSLKFTNNGTVIGNLGAALTLSSTGTVTNNKTMRADGGTLAITGTNVGQSAAGLIEAINGGNVTLGANASISGGTLGSATGGQVRTVSGQTGTIGNLVNAGTFAVVDNSTLVLQGTVTNNGALNVSSGGNFTDLLVAGNATLGGSGVTTLSNTTNNRIMAQGAGSQLTIGAGQTLQGAGSFGNGSALNIVNLGTVTANQGAPLNIAVSAAGSVQNQAGGLLQATSGGTLNLNSAVLNGGTIGANGGLVNANAGFTGNGTAITTGTGVLTLGAASTVGTLLNNGSSGGALALGGNNITVSADYTNANAGSGNSFNRRANVTGSGQILAGGNASQVISGSAVSGGNTNNATLTIGNVHVGANSYNYTIGNGGTTGPTLRGAIQTSVNGANISDARLSGSGVMAANYNAGAPAGAGAGQTVVFTAASAGTLAPMSGQVVNLRSNFDNIGDQKLNIVLGAGAAAYNLAGGNATSPVTVANQRVGGSNTVALNISNTAASGSFSEDLNAGVASVGGAATASGAVTGLLAGANNASGINVGVNTASAGAKTGTVNLAYASAGTVNGVSNGLGQTSVGNQAVTVNGNVYQAAAGQLVGNPLNFGTLQVGQNISQDLVVRNTASGAAGFVEDLNASFGAAGNSQISGSGSLSGITAGSNSTGANGKMTVTVTGTTAGALNSSITVNYASAGTVGGVSNGLGVLAVGSEAFGVNGTINATANVINLASPQFGSTSINLGAVRVGAASPTAALTLTNQATTAPQAALNASISSNTAAVTASGSVNLLAPGASSSALQVGLNTAVAGNYTGANAGSATVQLVSDASNVGGCAPNCQVSLAPQTVMVSGKVYTAAVGQLGTPVVDFGIVRVGDTVSAKNITVSNTAAVSALNDTLRATLSGVAGPFTGGAAASGIAAGSSGQISVGLNTAGAGVFTSNGSVGFLSQNPDMADVAAGANAAVQVKAQVNNLANADFDLLSGLGTLTDLGNGHYRLNLGNLALGSNGHWTLQIDNEVTGPADALKGSFDLGSVDDFSLGGFGLVGVLEAGQAQGGLGVDFMATQLGQFEDTITFNGLSFNASDPNGLSLIRSLQIVATVFDPNGNGTVPEPGTLALLMLAALGVWRGRAAALRRQAKEPA